MCEMSFVVFAIVIIFGIIFKESKIQRALMYCYIFVMIGFNAYSSDYANNLYMYNNINSELYTLYEPGYRILMQICNNLGTSFTFFRCVVAVISLVFIKMALKRMSNNENIVLSCLILYPVLLFASGLRGFIGFGISMFAFSVLYTCKKRKIIKFVLLISLATIFHYEYIFFLAYLFWGNKMTQIGKLRVFVIEVIAFVLYFSDVLYKVASKFIHSEKVLQWLDFNNYDHPSLVMDMIVIIVFAFVVYEIKKSFRYKIIENNEEKRMNIVNPSNILSFVVFMIPLLFMNYVFERLIEIPIVLLFIYTSNHGEMKAQRQFILTTREDIIPVFIAIALGLLFSVLVHRNLLTDIIFNNMYIG